MVGTSILSFFLSFLLLSFFASFSCLETLLSFFVSLLFLFDFLYILDWSFLAPSFDSESLVFLSLVFSFSLLLSYHVRILLANG